MVIFNMSRGQSDYFQATRGGGHGDYRHIVLAPMDVPEAVEFTQLAFHLADKWRNPVLVYGDFLIAHTYAAVDVQPIAFDALPPKEWGMDGTTSGTGRAKMISSIGIGKLHDMGPGIEAHFQAVGPHIAEIAAVEQRYDAGYLDDAEHVVVAFGSAGKFVRNVVAELRERGVRVGYVRPVTLWPFPYDAVRDAADGVQSVMVFENSAGQLIDDVKIAVEGRAPVVGIGGVSTDASGFGVGDLYDVDVIRARGSADRGPDRDSRSETMSGTQRTIVPTDAPPVEPSHEIGLRKPSLLSTEHHGFCPGCGEPIAARALLENLVELDVVNRVIAVIGIGCYTGFSTSFDLETVQALHGRAPSVATGVKRMQPDALVFTLQGDGDMVNEGLQEVLHTAARGEAVTAILLNNGVFGETGGHMTATTVLGQRTKNSLEGRDGVYHGYPIRIADLLAQLDGVAYVAAWLGAQRGRGGEDQEDGAQGVRRAARRTRLLVRRDPHHVPHRLVHRRARRCRLHGRDPRPGPHDGRAQRRLTRTGVTKAGYTRSADAGWVGVCLQRGFPSAVGFGDEARLAARAGLAGAPV